MPNNTSQRGLHERIAVFDCTMYAVSHARIHREHAQEMAMKGDANPPIVRHRMGMEMEMEMGTMGMGMEMEMGMGMWMEMEMGMVRVVAVAFVNSRLYTRIALY